VWGVLVRLCCVRARAAGFGRGRGTRSPKRPLAPAPRATMTCDKRAVRARLASSLRELTTSTTFLRENGGAVAHELILSAPPTGTHTKWCSLANRAGTFWWELHNPASRTLYRYEQTSGDPSGDPFMAEDEVFSLATSFWLPPSDSPNIDVRVAWTVDGTTRAHCYGWREGGLPVTRACLHEVRAHVTRVVTAFCTQHAASMERALARTARFKEELMMDRWSPARVRRLVEVYGLDDWDEHA
jgi:hypothetical protein